MRRYGNLWSSLVSWPNLLRAARKAQRGKRDKGAVQRFNFGQETELLRLQDELEAGTYQPGAFRSHWITRPKPRMISAAPYRDRVVHHALMNIFEPILERHFHPDSYACRAGKGTHAAVRRLQVLMRRNRYAVHCDIRKYFPSIDHEVLKATFRRLLKDRRVLWLMDLIVDSSNPQEPVLDWFPGDDLFSPSERPRGLPIGNLTSQWFANWMVNDVDHFLTSGLGVGGYVRYCDDMILLDDDRRRLRLAVDALRQQLAALRFRLHEERMHVRPVRAGLAFVGYRVWPAFCLVRKENVRAFRKRLRFLKAQYARGAVGPDDVHRRLAGWIGHAEQADSGRLLDRLSEEWVFQRGRAVTQPCSSGRLVEQ